MTLSLFMVTKDQLLTSVQQMLEEYQVVAFKKTPEALRYDYIASPIEIEWHYSPSVLSPKKFFFPVKETLLEYQIEGNVSSPIEAKPLVLFGIRPCDLNGIKILDEAFAEGNGDPNYMSKRESSIVIGLDCKTICDEHAFCYRVDSQEAKGGFDLILYETGDNFLVRVGTEKGEAFLKQYISCTEATDKDWDAYQQLKQAGFDKKKPFEKLKDFPEIFDKNKDHEVWKQEADRCLSCGSCIMVCPTCYCFDVVDELELNLKQGTRERTWDACMLNNFAVVAGGENFRPSSTERLKHRINRKFNYLMRKHGQSVCVGCGRCVRACLADISPKKIAQVIADEKE